MDKQRFIEFRKYFIDKMNELKDGESKIEDLLFELLLLYPELDENYELPDFVSQEINAYVDVEMDEAGIEEDVIEEPQTVKKKRKPKNVDEIRKRLLESLKRERWKDYTDFCPDLSNEESCLKALGDLEEASSDGRKRLVYFSYLKGEVLKRLQQINLFDLALEHNRSMYSD